MRKIIVFAALALLTASVKAEELLLPGIDSVKAGSSAPAGEAEVARPDSQKVLAGLVTELRLSSKQEERIAAVVDKKSKEFDKLSAEYAKVSAEEKKWQYKANELKYEMSRINTNMPDAIRDLLDDDQRQTYDAMLAAKDKPAAPEVKTEAVPAVKPAKRRKLIKRRKPKAGSSAALTPAAVPPAAEAAAEEGPGRVMIDNEPAAAPAAAGPGKKRALKNKTAAPAPDAPAENIMANEPAPAKPAVKEAPIEDAADMEDAGSYP